MSEVKDKFIGIFAVKPERDLSGNEVKVKRYIHSVNRLHAYARDLSEKEKFAAKAAGSEQTILFKINYNSRVKTGLYVEYRGETYTISSVDGYEGYKRDLVIRAAKAKPEVYDYEEFDE